MNSIQQRINSAIRHILSERPTNRTFDGYFEEGDGDALVEGIVRRATQDPKLDALLPRYISPSSIAVAKSVIADELPAHDPDRWQTTDAAEDSDRTNGMRATEAHDALKHPQALAHEEDFSDLITNLLHLAHSLQHDPESIIRTALANFQAEAGPLPA